MTMGYFRIVIFSLLAGMAAFSGTAQAESATMVASASPAAAAIDVSVMAGKITLRVPAEFVNQTREQAASQNTGVKIQLLADRQRQQVVGISEVPTADGDANDNSEAAFNKMAQGILSGLKTQYKDVKKTGQTRITAGGQQLLRLDTRQTVQDKLMSGTTLVTPYQANVVTLQVLSPAADKTGHAALVKFVLESLAFH